MNYLLQRKYCITFLLIIFSGLLSCKKDRIVPRQVEQVTIPTSRDINSILFINDSIGFMAGGDKYTGRDLLITTDGGRTWHNDSASGGDSKAVYGLAYDGQTVYGAGYDGKIYLHDTGGNGWQMVQTPAWEWFQQIQFTGPGHGFVVAGEGYRAGRIYRTDGTGHISLVDSFEFQLADIRFATSQKGYASGYGAVVRTGDGGNSWQLLDVKGDFFRSISCIGDRDVWIVGYNGSILHSSDGGDSWDRQRDGNNPLLKKYRLRSVVFRDTHTGYAAGDGGILLKTTDGGEHWSEFESFTDNDLRCMTLTADGTLWVAGSDGTLVRIIE